VRIQQASLPIDSEARVRLLARAPMKGTRKWPACVRLECLNLPLPIPTYAVNFFTLGLKCFHIDRRRPKILGDRCTDTVAQQSSLTLASTLCDLGARFPQIFQLCAKKGGV